MGNTFNYRELYSWRTLSTRTSDVLFSVCRDLQRLWLRNMGRDARVLGAFGRWARFPFLDEHLLRFVCCAVPFEHVVQPVCSFRKQAEATIQELMRAAGGRSTVHSNETQYRLKGSDRQETEKIKPDPEADTLCTGNKWLLRLCAAHFGLKFSAVAKKRAMQFGTRSAKVSNSECFSSNRKARGDAAVQSDTDTG